MVFTSRNTPWPSEKEAALIECLKNKMTARQTADQIGMTRNSIIGKARRMGLEFLSVPKRPIPFQGRQKRIRKPRVIVAPKFPYRETPPIAPEPHMDPLMLVFEDLKNSPVISQCRFPYGENPREIVYCGLPTVDGESWCAAHYRTCCPSRNHQKTDN